MLLGIKNILFIGLLIFGNISLYANVNISSNDQVFNVSKHLGIYKDYHNQLTIQDMIEFEIPWKPAPFNNHFSNGFSSKTMWAHTIINNTSNDSIFIIASNFANIDNLTFYSQQNSANIDSLNIGKANLLAKSQNQLTSLPYKIKLQPKKSLELWVKIQTTKQQIFKINIGSIHAHDNYTINNNIKKWIIYGIFIAAICFMMLLWFIHRSAKHTFMMFFCFFITTLCMLEDGTLYFFFPDLIISYYNNLMTIALAIIITGTLFYTNEYTNSKTKYSILNITSIAISVVFWLLVFISFSFPTITLFFSLLLSTFVFIFITILSLNSLKRDNHSSKYFFIGWFIFTSGFCYYALTIFGLIPILEINLFHFAILIQIIFFFIGVIYNQNNEYDNANTIKSNLEKKNLALSNYIDKERIDLVKKKKSLESANTKIHDSIEYAKIIQHGINDISKNLNQYFSQNSIMHFAYNYDIDVMTTNYWSRVDNDKIIIVLTKQTGENILGAFQGLLTISLLDEIYTRFCATLTPLALINYLNNYIYNNKNNIQQSLSEMSISVVEFNISTKILSYATANQPIYISRITKNNDDAFTSTSHVDSQKLQSSIYPVGPNFIPINNQLQNRFALRIESTCNLYLISKGILKNHLLCPNYEELIPYLKNIGGMNATNQWKSINSKYTALSKENKLNCDLDILGVEINGK